ncbi:pectin acetylesterase-family hydrolase [Leptospira neocaledonica]|uniref:Pectinacetylesterase n=1 Tax=Leptospira neocaledonica TaxID=2023192 RepID=A0A2M9ZY71_9LEPT|nr:pectin acetylesterase-family hydrolase [Leptospira neocaledonica]PJZ76987.1 pectinacetylesterase [Leptospira neocaledonica]
MTIRLLTIFLIFSQIYCTKDKDDSQELLTTTLIVDLVTSPFTRITPEPGTFTTQVDHGGTPYTYTAIFDPKCSGTEGNVNFYFFRKTVAANNKKLLINFMGGGACWDNANCFGSNTVTYFNQLNTVPDFALDLLFKGVIDQTVAENPFKDYDIIFVPYCSGDLHVGSKDKTYASGTIKHHGYDNVISVLKFVQNSYSQLDRVFVTGQSAGGYGAILNYPIIRETVTTIDSGAKVRMLSDASNAVVPTGTYTIGPAFFPLLESSWGVETNGIGSGTSFSNSNLPIWVNGITANYTTTGSPSINDFFKKVAAEYPLDVLGQYTALFDGNQRFFYHVMGQINKINNSSIAYSTATTPDPYQAGKSYSIIYGDSDGSSVPDGNSSSSKDYTTCDWSQQAVSKMKDASSMTNYRYYIGPGDIHTITTYNDMYSLKSGGVKFSTWLNTLANGASPPANVQCNDSSGSCVNTNLFDSTINENFGKATSDESYSTSPKQDMYTTCGGAAGIGL